MASIRRVRAPLFWMTLVFTYVMAIIPGDAAPTLGGSDKTDHMVAFLTLTLLCRSAYWARPAWLAAVGLSAFGAFIEISQGTAIIGRDANVADWVADTLAIGVGIGISMVIQRGFPSLYMPDD